MHVLDEGLLEALARNCGNAYLAGVRAVGKPWHVDEDLTLSDLGLPVEVPANNATLVREPSDDRVGDIAERVDAFFSGAPGGGYELWSIWPSVDLSPFGFERGAAPCMVRDPGGDPPPTPEGLEIEEVGDAAGMRDVWRVVDAVFCEGRAPEPVWDERVLGEDYRVWVGRLDGRPVTTATASVGDGFVGVYAVGTLPEARGRGFGEAITWPATLCRPDLPATLQASSMGRPIYERMGYRTVATFTLWGRAERV